jgi:hypothetical protein
MFPGWTVDVVMLRSCGRRHLSFLSGNLAFWVGKMTMVAVVVTMMVVTNLWTGLQLDLTP